MEENKQNTENGDNINNSPNDIKKVRKDENSDIIIGGKNTDEVVRKTHEEIVKEQIEKQSPGRIHSPSENAESAWKFDLEFFRPAIVLAIISVIVAFLLAMMNHCSSPIIEERKAAEKIQAVAELFGEGIKTEAYDIELTGPVYEILKVFSGNEFIGYCVATAPKGFSGKIDILVAVNPDCSVKSVKILSMSETAGIGTKTQEASFLSQFVGKTNGISANSDNENSIDTISGATVTSKAVLNGINSALEIFSSLQDSETSTDITEGAADSTSETETQEITVGEYIPTEENISAEENAASEGGSD